MSRQVTITSVTANTPVDISYCDAFSASCVFVSSVATFPFVFDVPPPYDTQNIVIKIEDTQGCTFYETIFITPTPTPSLTASPTVTPTVSPTNTGTPTQTPTETPTQTPTPSITPSGTRPPFPPIVPGTINQLQIGQSTICCDYLNACTDTLCDNYLYNFTTEATTIPVIGTKIYSTYFSGNLYNVFNGGNNWILMNWPGGTYSVQISDQGEIVDFELCTINPTPTPTKTSTPTPSVTPSSP